MSAAASGRRLCAWLIAETRVGVSHHLKELLIFWQCWAGLECGCFMLWGAGLAWAVRVLAAEVLAWMRFISELLDHD